MYRVTCAIRLSEIWGEVTQKHRVESFNFPNLSVINGHFVFLNSSHVERADVYTFSPRKMFYGIGNAVVN